MEIERLCNFVQENRHVLAENLTDKLDDMLISDNLKQKFAEADKDEEIRKINNPVTKVLAIALRGLAQRTNLRQNNFSEQMKENTKFLQQQAFDNETAINDSLKNLWLADQEAKLGKQLSTHVREGLENELRGKLSHINEMAAEEQDHQNHMMEDLLSKREVKRQKLRKILESLGDRKLKEDQRYHDKLLDIKNKETEEKQMVDAEIEQLRKNEARDIHKGLQEQRREQLALKEKQMEDYKKLKGKGFDPESELVFSDMLADYGSNVKILDSQLLSDKAIQEAKLEERLADRKQARLREVEQKRKDKEAVLNADTVKITSKLNLEAKQIETLLDPIQDEEERMKIILEKSKPVHFLNAKQTLGQIEPSKEAREASAQLQKDIHDFQIRNFLKQVDNQNEIRRREVEQQRTFIQNQIDSSNTEEEKQRLMKQLEQFETILTQELASQQNEQMHKLRS